MKGRKKGEERTGNERRKEEKMIKRKWEEKSGKGL